MHCSAFSIGEPIVHGLKLGGWFVLSVATPCLCIVVKDILLCNSNCGVSGCMIGNPREAR